jgi:hypothetical protein
MSSGFCSAGHWLIGFGGMVVEVVCNGALRHMVEISHGAIDWLKIKK